MRLLLTPVRLIALTAALDDLDLLGEFYSCIYVPYEVEKEIRVYGADGFALKQVEQAQNIPPSPSGRVPG